MKSFEKLEILRAAVCVVAVDGEVTAEENTLIEKLAKDIGVGLASRTAMLERGKNDPDFCQQMFNVLKTDPDETMLTLFHSAMADGKLQDSEIRVLQHFATKLDIDEGAFANLVEKAKSMLSK